MPSRIRKLNIGRKRIGLGLLAVLLLLVAGGYTQLSRHTDGIADLSRQTLGDEKTARLESWYLAGQDRVDQLKYRLFGRSTDPFGQGHVQLRAVSAASETTANEDYTFEDEFPTIAAPVAVEQPKPAPLELPEINPLGSNVNRGEAAWTTDGLPHSSPDDVLMAKTLFRPDPVRPYAAVGVLLIDKRRIRLHMTGGTEDPGGDLGIRGPGIVPDADRSDLLAAWNGGFKGPHGNWGMIADGKQYRPLRNGYASVAVSDDGTITIGEWGRDLSWNDDIVAVRQNAVLLVDNCEISRRANEGNNTWGYVQVNSAEFITWRSAIGVTRNGDLLVASGNSLSAATLARALWAAGACYAMQLDINTPYVLTSLFFPQEDGSIGRAKFMGSMVDNPGRFLTRQTRDFMYVTLDETNFKP
ncbi:MAG TPA: phosphodiester glycosidase family protein [Dehalococcoidia bacterium]|nr:phosphodiester glycosidase family protein [Dehalococcoidia bacterium]